MSPYLALQKPKCMISSFQFISENFKSITPLKIHRFTFRTFTIIKIRQLTVTYVSNVIKKYIKGF